MMSTLRQPAYIPQDCYLHKKRFLLPIDTYYWHQQLGMPVLHPILMMQSLHQLLVCSQSMMYFLQMKKPALLLLIKIIMIM
jgi:hypothetical protein